MQPKHSFGIFTKAQSNVTFGDGWAHVVDRNDISNPLHPLNPNSPNHPRAIGRFHLHQNPILGDEGKGKIGRFHELKMDALENLTDQIIEQYLRDRTWYSKVRCREALWNMYRRIEWYVKNEIDPQKRANYNQALQFIKDCINKILTAYVEKTLVFEEVFNVDGVYNSKIKFNPAFEWKGGGVYSVENKYGEFEITFDYTANHSGYLFFQYGGTFAGGDKVELYDNGVKIWEGAESTTGRGVNNVELEIEAGSHKFVWVYTSYKGNPSPYFWFDILRVYEDIPFYKSKAMPLEDMEVKIDEGIEKEEDCFVITLEQGEKKSINRLAEFMNKGFIEFNVTAPDGVEVSMRVNGSKKWSSRDCKDTKFGRVDIEKEGKYDLEWIISADGKSPYEGNNKENVFYAGFNEPNELPKEITLSPYVDWEWEDIYETFTNGLGNGDGVWKVDNKVGVFEATMSIELAGNGFVEFQYGGKFGSGDIVELYADGIMIWSGKKNTRDLEANNEKVNISRNVKELKWVYKSIGSVDHPLFWLDEIIINHFPSRIYEVKVCGISHVEQKLENNEFCGYKVDIPHCPQPYYEKYSAPWFTHFDGKDYGFPLFSLKCLPKLKDLPGHFRFVSTTEDQEWELVHSTGKNEMSGNENILKIDLNRLSYGNSSKIAFQWKFRNKGRIRFKYLANVVKGNGLLFFINSQQVGGEWSETSTWQEVEFDFYASQTMVFEWVVRKKDERTHGKNAVYVKDVEVFEVTPVTGNPHPPDADALGYGKAYAQSEGGWVMYPSKSVAEARFNGFNTPSYNSLSIEFDNMESQCDGDICFSYKMGVAEPTDEEVRRLFYDDPFYGLHTEGEGTLLPHDPNKAIGHHHSGDEGGTPWATYPGMYIATEDTTNASYDIHVGYDHFHDKNRVDAEAIVELVCPPVVIDHFKIENKTPSIEWQYNNDNNGHVVLSRSGNKFTTTRAMRPGFASYYGKLFAEYGGWVEVTVDGQLGDNDRLRLRLNGEDEWDFEGTSFNSDTYKINLADGFNNLGIVVSTKGKSDQSDGGGGGTGKGTPGGGDNPTTGDKELKFDENFNDYPNIHEKISWSGGWKFEDVYQKWYQENYTPPPKKPYQDGVMIVENQPSKYTKHEMRLNNIHLNNYGTVFFQYGSEFYGGDKLELYDNGELIWWTSASEPDSWKDADGINIEVDIPPGAHNFTWVYHSTGEGGVVTPPVPSTPGGEKTYYLNMKQLSEIINTEKGSQYRSGHSSGKTGIYGGEPAHVVNSNNGVIRRIVKNAGGVSTEYREMVYVFRGEIKTAAPPPKPTYGWTTGTLVNSATFTGTHYGTSITRDPRVAMCYANTTPAGVGGTTWWTTNSFTVKNNSLNLSFNINYLLNDKCRGVVTLRNSSNKVVKTLFDSSKGDTGLTNNVPMSFSYNDLPNGTYHLRWEAIDLTPDDDDIMWTSGTKFRYYGIGITNLSIKTKVQTGTVPGGGGGSQPTQPDGTVVIMQIKKNGVVQEWQELGAGEHHIVRNFPTDAEYEITYTLKKGDGTIGGLDNKGGGFYTKYGKFIESWDGTEGKEAETTDNPGYFWIDTIRIYEYPPEVVPEIKDPIPPEETDLDIRLNFFINVPVYMGGCYDSSMTVKLVDETGKVISSKTFKGKGEDGGEHVFAVSDLAPHPYTNYKVIIETSQGGEISPVTGKKYFTEFRVTSFKAWEKFRKLEPDPFNSRLEFYIDGELMDTYHSDGGFYVDCFPIKRGVHSYKWVLAHNNPVEAIYPWDYAQLDWVKINNYVCDEVLITPYCEPGGGDTCIEALIRCLLCIIKQRPKGCVIGKRIWLFT